MTTSLILAAVLTWSPPQPSYEQSQINLGSAANSIAEVSPAEAIVLLNQALDDALIHPQDLLSDPTAVDKLARARLALVWAYLAQDDAAAATATMDAAIRSAGARALPLAGLGPTVRALHDERRAELEAEGHGTVVVDCDACEVLIDDARSENPSEPLLLGPHRVWVFDPHGELDPLFEEVVLEIPEQEVSLVFRAAKPGGEPSTAGDTPVDIRAKRQKGAPTKVPRWAKIVGMSVGAGLVVAGGVMLALDGQCRDGSTPSPDNLDSPGCRQVWNRNKIPDFALIGVGAGVFVGASVWLTFDEVRAGQSRRTSAMLGWTVRF